MRFSHLLRRSKPSSTKNKRHPGSKKGSVPLVCDDVICDPEEVAFTTSKLAYESAATKALLTSATSSSANSNSGIPNTGTSNSGTSNTGTSNNESCNNESSNSRKRSLNCTKFPPHLLNHTYAKQLDSISDSALDDDTCYACKMEELQRQALIKQEVEEKLLEEELLQKQSLQNQQSLKKLSEKLLSEKSLSESRLSINHDSGLSDQESSRSHPFPEFSLPSVDIHKLEMVSLPPSLKKARIGGSSECIKSLQPSSSSQPSLPQLELNKDDSDTETEELEDSGQNRSDQESPSTFISGQSNPSTFTSDQSDPITYNSDQSNPTTFISGQSNQEESRSVPGQNEDLTPHSLPPPLSSIPPS